MSLLSQPTHKYHRQFAADQHSEAVDKFIYFDFLENPAEWSDDEQQDRFADSKLFGTLKIETAVS